jgi:putative transcriptional regulator
MTEHVRNTLSDYRDKHHLTQEELARALGVTRQTMIAIEKGNYTPSVLLAMKIAKYFKKPVERIFTLVI